MCDVALAESPALAFSCACLANSAMAPSAAAAAEAAVDDSAMAASIRVRSPEVVGIWRCCRARHKTKYRSGLFGLLGRTETKKGLICREN